jgi:hypothetical protein
MMFLSYVPIFSVISLGIFANALNDNIGLHGNVRRQLPYHGGKASKGGKSYGHGKASKSSHHYYTKSKAAKAGHHSSSSDSHSYHSEGSETYASFSAFRKLGDADLVDGNTVEASMMVEKDGTYGGIADRELYYHSKSGKSGKSYGHHYSKSSKSGYHHRDLGYYSKSGKSGKSGKSYGYHY